MPKGVDWFVWRVLTHPRSRATLQEIEEHWSAEDLVDAHLVLDMYDHAERVAHARARQRSYP